MSKPAEHVGKGKVFVGSAATEAARVANEHDGINWSVKIRPSAEVILCDHPKFDILHACCQYVSDPNDLSQSHLLLYKESDDNEFE